MARVARVLMGTMLLVGVISAVMAQPSTSEVADAPPGITVLVSVQELLVRPRGTAVASKRTVVKKRAVVNPRGPVGPVVAGKRTVVKKRTTVRRRGGVAIRGFYTKPGLSNAIEGLLTNSEHRSDESVTHDVASLLGYESSSDDAASVNQELKELLQYRNDPNVLHERVQAFVNSVVEDDGGDDDNDNGDDDNGGDDNSGDDNGSDDNGSNDNGSDDNGDGNGSGDDNGGGDDGGKGSDDNGGFGYRTLYRRTVARRTTYGWRYPLHYWNLYGPSLYPGPCYLGAAYGPYFYC